MNYDSSLENSGPRTTGYLYAKKLNLDPTTYTT